MNDNNAVAKKEQSQVTTIGNYLNNDKIKKFLESMLKERTGSFITSMVSLVNLNKNLQDCTPQSLTMCGLKAASMGLALDPNLGHAYPVPYKDNRRGITEAQFQMGYKGYVQLAMRTGQYRKIVVTDIRYGELLKNDPITETYEFSPILDEVKREAAAIIGYYTMIELHNGYKKELYWPIDRIMTHAKRYSKGFNRADGSWSTNKHEMCCKTMLRQIIPKWGPMSIEMQQAFQADMGVIHYDEESNQEVIEYIDNPSKDAEEEATESDGSEPNASPDPLEEEFRRNKANAVNEG